MATPAQAMAAARAAKVAELSAAVRDAGMRGAHAKELADIAISRSPPGLASLGEHELGVQVLGGPAAFDAPHIVGAENERYQSWLAGQLRGAADSGRAVPDEYLRFLLDAGVDAGTVQAVRSGDLPMDTESRLARAGEMGINLGRRWHRVDQPGKTQFRGRARSGVVYAGFSPELAKQASQAGSAQRYAMVAPAAIHALPAGSRHARRLVDAVVTDRQRLLSASNRRFSVEDAWESQLPTSADNLRPGTHLTPGGSVWHNPIADQLPFYSDIENREAVDSLRRSGLAGTLVQDEGGISVGLVTPTLRHASLSVLNPSKTGGRNIFYALPAAIGAGAASQEQPGVLDGLRSK